MAIKSSGKFSRGYKGGRRSSDINSFPSAAYVKACEANGWTDSLSKYCAACGYLPSWCVCADIIKAYENMDDVLIRLGRKNGPESQPKQQEQNG